MRDIVPFATVEDESIRQRVIKVFGVHARWRYFDALERLSTIALDKNRPEADRIAAVNALDYSVELDANGGLALDYPRRVLNMRGTRALWTFIELLSDASTEIRQLSADALNRYNPENGFDYDPNTDESSRINAVSQWVEWGIDTLSQNARPGYKVPPVTDTKRFTLTVWFSPPNARVYMNNKLMGVAPLTLSIEGTPDRKFVKLTVIMVAAISENVELPSRYNQRWYAVRDIIPDEISKIATTPDYFRVWYGDSFLFGNEQ